MLAAIQESAETTADLSGSNCGARLGSFRVVAHGGRRLAATRGVGRTTTLPVSRACLPPGVHRNPKWAGRQATVPQSPLKEDFTHIRRRLKVSIPCTGEACRRRPKVSIRATGPACLLRADSRHRNKVNPGPATRLRHTSRRLPPAVRRSHPKDFPGLATAHIAKAIKEAKEATGATIREGRADTGVTVAVMVAGR